MNKPVLVIMAAGMGSRFGGLKQLAKENFSNLAPSKALVVLEYSHPPLSQRIAAIEAAIVAQEGAVQTRSEE